MILCLFFGAEGIGIGFAADKVTPEEVIAAHVKSIGSPEALAALKTMAFVGTTSVDFIQGMYGKMSGSSMLVSDANKMSLVLQYGDINYPKEYFAYDGKEVSVGYINPGQMSPLADFIFRNNGIMKEGLLGGVLSLGWPLLDIDKHQAWMKYSQAEINGKRLHEIEYRPKNSLRDVKIKLYFDMETYHHVRTEYRIRVRDDMSASPGGGGSRVGIFQQASPSETSTSTLSNGLPDSIYSLVETFGDFKKVGAMTLPHLYTIDYSVEGQGHTFIAKWTVNVAQWVFNRTYDDKIFIAQK